MGTHGPINAVATDGTGDRFLTAGQDGTVRLWGPDGAPEEALPGEGEEKPAEGGGGVPVRTATFDPAGERVIAAGDDGVARIWNVRSGRLEHVLSAHDGVISRAGFSPGGGLALTAGKDGKAVVWDADSGDRVATLAGHSGAVNDARFSPDGELVVTASDDESARIWEASSGDQLQLLRGHEARVVSGLLRPRWETRPHGGMGRHRARLGGQLRRAGCDTRGTGQLRLPGRVHSRRGGGDQRRRQQDVSAVFLRLCLTPAALRGLSPRSG